MEDRQKVYIKGCPTRGDEVIKILTDLGGHNTPSYNGKNEAAYYFINPDGIIDSTFPFRSGTFPFIKEFYKEISLPRWKPKNEESYYFLDDRGTIITSMWNDIRTDNLRYEYGNCFSTSEEAEAASNKIKELLNNKA